MRTSRRNLRSSIKRRRFNESKKLDSSYSYEMLSSIIGLAHYISNNPSMDIEDWEDAIYYEGDKYFDVSSCVEITLDCLNI